MMIYCVCLNRELNQLMHMPLTWIPNSLLSCHCLNNVGHLATVGSLLPDIMNSWSETQYLHVCVGGGGGGTVHRSTRPIMMS